MPDDRRHSPWRAELDDLLRGVAGAYLFGSPFLYTMEVWWKGNSASPLRMILTLALTYLALLTLNRAFGFRRQQPNNWRRSIADSAESLALGLFTAAISLALLGIINPADGIKPVMGRIIMEAMPFSIGVGLANSFMKKADENDSDSEGDESVTEDLMWKNDSWRATVVDLGATMLGAMIIASSIAPTDEIQAIAANLSPPMLLMLIAVSILLSYVIVFIADFGAQEMRVNQRGIFQTPLSETLISYLASLMISLSMLWLFQLLDEADPLNKWVSYTLVLGFPATIGGAAKEKWGQITDDPNFESEGRADRAKGEVQEGYGEARRKVGEAIEDIGKKVGK